MESTEIAPGARFYVGKFARRVSRRYQAYMRRKRHLESRAWFCNCGAPDCHFCALTQRLLFSDLYGEETPQTARAPATGERAVSVTGSEIRSDSEMLRIIGHYNVRVGKFARRVGKKYQAYMKLKRRIEDRAWVCNCGAPECCFCALTQRLLLSHLRGGGTPQTMPSPATPPPDERERSLALPRVLQRAANLAGRELRQPGGVQHERLGVYLEAEAEELSDRTTGEFHSEAGSIAHGTGGHGGSGDGSGGGGGRREAQKQHKEVKARQSAQGGGEK